MVPSGLVIAFLVIELIAVVLAIMFPDGGALVFISFCLSCFASLLWFFITGLSQSYGWMFIGWFITMLLPAVASMKYHDVVSRVKNKKAQTQIARQKESNERERAKVRAEDEKRVSLHIEDIRKSTKSEAFKTFFFFIINRIAWITVNNGTVTIGVNKSSSMFIPDYNSGTMVLNTSGGIEQATFFGQEYGERPWTVFEAEALTRVIDGTLQQAGGFRRTGGGSDITGYRRYEAIPPDTIVVANRPY